VLVHEVNDLDYSMLGWSLSRILKGEIPLLCGVRPSFDEAKKLAFTINASGRLPLFRMKRGIAPPPDLEKIDLDGQEMQGAIEAERSFAPDLAIVGCPHLSEQEINWWSKCLADRFNRSMEAWFFTSRLCSDKCPLSGAVLRSTGRVFIDCCPLTMQKELGGRNVACDNPALAAILTSAGVKAQYVPPKFLRELMVT
jgi:predicted aconitase